MSMKIIQAMAIPVELQLKEPFAIANETIEVANNSIDKVGDRDGHNWLGMFDSGFGDFRDKGYCAQKL